MDVGMVFAIILTTIVIVLILTFGMEQIRELLGIGKLAQVANSMQKLRDDVDLVYTLAEGTTKPFKLGIPSDVRFCFVDIQNTGANEDSEYFADPKTRWNPEAGVAREIGRKGYNIWIYQSANDFGKGYLVENLDPEESFCALGPRSLILQNKGFFVDIAIIA
ncbi:MAG: hypothetical protein HY518_03420 [Candidatus Aenigmarchaeota archaeon]|nr:hypothetical protein [Candidatus Aenigmarchaeota archaeon]